MKIGNTNRLACSYRPGSYLELCKGPTEVGGMSDSPGVKQ